ncbi:hypothetical protein OQA88_9717 [Cercophora sp. LCS_1]
MAQQSTLDPTALSTFQSHLAASSRIIIIIGAGLSAASGLPTFRSTNGLWCDHDVFLVASPAGWRRDPGLVWQFYADRRRAALRAQPNAAHHALATLAKQKPGFVALSQNIDGLLQRAGLPPGAQFKELHGDLFRLVCERRCGYSEINTEEELREVLKEGGERRRRVLGAGETEKPRVSALLFEGIREKHRRILGEERFVEGGLTGVDAAPLRVVGMEVRKPEVVPELRSGIEREELPRCKGEGCEGLLRPGVVWFGEALDEGLVKEVEGYWKEKVDLCVVVGTSGTVWPTAGFHEEARKAGARVAWVNTTREDCKAREGDWVFVGDAGVVMPEILGFGVDGLERDVGV